MLNAIEEEAADPVAAADTANELVVIEYPNAPAPYKPPAGSTSTPNLLTPDAFPYMLASAALPFPAVPYLKSK